MTEEEQGRLSFHEAMNRRAQIEKNWTGAYCEVCRKEVGALLIRADYLCHTCSLWLCGDHLKQHLNHNVSILEVIEGPINLVVLEEVKKEDKPNV